MRELTLIAQRQGQGYILQSPRVGHVSHLPIPGQILTSETVVGQLTTLSTTYQLRLPPQFAGQVASYNTELKIRPVAYLTPLFPIVPVHRWPNGTADQLLQSETLEGIPNVAGVLPVFSVNGKDEKASATQNAQNQGKLVVKAPTDGIFYRRPSPDSPAYVEVGQTIAKDQVLGLVEVMKCFNQILADLPNFPAEAKLLEICVGDGSEVKYQQPLFIFGS